MTTKTDGGSAFPHEQGLLNPGLTMRDYFAAKALPLAFERWRYNLTKDLGDEWHWKDSDWEDVAYLAYGLADAMLKEREKT